MRLSKILLLQALRLWIIGAAVHPPERIPMNEPKKKRSKRIGIVGLVAFLALGLTIVFLSATLSRPGIGIIGNPSPNAPSPVGTWKHESGNVIRFFADGTAISRKGGQTTHIEWQLDGTDLGYFFHGPPDSMGGRLNRVFCTLGVDGYDQPYNKFKLVEATSEKLVLTIDEDPPVEGAFERGDRIEYVAVPE